jgi:multicomponent K+:H+ antiporter subunit A
MRVPVEILVLLCLIVGVAPASSIGPLLDAASRQVVGTPPAYSLKVWHGVTPALLMSVVALIGGTVAYLIVRRLEKRGGLAILELRGLSGAKLFFGAMSRMTVLSRWIRSRILSSGLQRQLLAIVVVTLLVGLWTLGAGIGRGDRPLVPLSPVFAGLWIIGGASAVAAAWQAKFHRPAALLFSGTAGAVCCVTFIWFSAPDLALTQLTVEVVTTLLILLGLRWLPPREPNRGLYNRRTRRIAAVRRTRDGIIAISAGLGMALLSYAVMTREIPARTDFFLQKALSEGGGRNVVNVMLVDFRGFDTFGEGIVLAIVALTVYALLRRFRPAPEVMPLPPQQQLDLQTDLVHPRQAKDPAVGYLTVPAVLVRLMLPISGVVAVFFFLRGHNAPGGGFVAGLIMSVGLLIQYIVSGTEWVEEHVGLRPRTLIGLGILFVAGTASAPFLVDYPLLTSHTFHLELPLLGEIHVGSATFFDVGVFCLVLGSTLFILVALAHQSIRAHRATGGK